MHPTRNKGNVLADALSTHTVSTTHALHRHKQCCQNTLQQWMHPSTLATVTFTPSDTCTHASSAAAAAAVAVAAARRAASRSRFSRSRLPPRVARLGRWPPASPLPSPLCVPQSPSPSAAPSALPPGPNPAPKSSAEPPAPAAPAPPPSAGSALAPSPSPSPSTPAVPPAAAARASRRSRFSLSRLPPRDRRGRSALAPPPSPFPDCCCCCSSACAPAWAVPSAAAELGA
ncbi:hypothetical protein COO60DRAFT_1500424 [Scenedesmus sp. NREL 46B-D3]|nr:hypothetical protein COO60DRAFT_1500424 [Scenedesmus sp. NREL 46B-D3]